MYILSNLVELGRVGLVYSSVLLPIGVFLFFDFIDSGDIVFGMKSKIAIWADLVDGAGICPSKNPQVVLELFL